MSQVEAGSQPTEYTERRDNDTIMIYIRNNSDTEKKMKIEDVEQRITNYFWTCYLYGPVRYLGPKQARAAAQPPSNGPSIGFARIKIITYRAV